MSDVDERLAGLSPERRALLMKTLRGPSGTRRNGAEPIAIVGMACRFPGGADDPDRFFANLLAGVDALADPTPGRARSLPPEGSGAPRFTALLRDVEGFDAAFFGIAPREALAMDPQHRLLLEVAWEAIEDAGLPPGALAGSATGVFVAVYQRDFGRLLFGDPARADAYAVSGTHHSIAPNRLSYLLDLRGPSLAVDSACSSSLVALHLACRSLLAGECRRAIVGAANLVLAADETRAMGRFGMLAADGRCKPFDARADGFVRGEGVAAIVLERLADARAEGRPARAVVRGTAIGQDGRTNGLTAPSPRAQAAVIRAALDDARLAAEGVDFVEAHGTGTPLGDPIEIDALREVHEGRTRPLAIGAVKSSVGHLEAAAGLAGVVKTVLALERGVLPPNLHFERLNPHVDPGTVPFVFPTAPLPIPAGEAPRRAGVSSFGMGGSDAHVILEEAPPAQPRAPRPDGRAELVLLSARSPGALSLLARSHREALAQGGLGGFALADIAAATALRRGHEPERLAVVARTRGELAERLGAHLAREAAPGLRRGRAARDAERGLVLVFPGQGSQWPGMGRALLAEPAFASALAEADRAIRAAGGPAVAELVRVEAPLDRVDVVQPALFALGVALAAWLRALGVVPSAVVGHSLGEVAAAHVAGALDLGDAARVIVTRSRLLARIAGRGVMLAVEAASEVIAARLPAGVTIAAENGPISTIVAGAPEAIEALAAALEAEGVLARRVRVDVASHGPAVEALAAELERSLAGIVPRAPSIPLATSTRGGLAREPLDPAFWADNLRRPARFWAALGALVREGHGIFVELGGHPTLAPAIADGLAALGACGTVLAPLRRGEDDRAGLLDALGALHVAGVPIAWVVLHPEGAVRVPLPTTPWQHERFPIPVPVGARSAEQAAPIPLAHAPGQHVLAIELGRASAPWLADHLVDGVAIVPGTTWLVLALRAARAVLGEAIEVRDVAFERPLLVPDEGACEVQLLLREEDEGGAFEVHGRAPGERAFTRLATGRIARASAAPPRIDLDSVYARSKRALDGAAFYEDHAARGNVWGPSFQGVRSAALGEGEVLARLEIPPPIEAEVRARSLHPAWLDACGQALLAALPLSTDGGAFVFAHLDRATLHDDLAAAAHAHVVLRPASAPGRVTGDVTIADASGAPVAELAGLAIQFLDLDARALAGAIHEVRFLPAPHIDPPRPIAGIAILGAGAGLGAALAAFLAARGDRTALLPEGAAASPGALREATDAAFGRDVEGLALVHLAGLDLPPSEADPADHQAAALAALTSALHAAQALADRPGAARLWIVTRGAVPAGEPHRVAVAAGPLWGLARTIAAEHPEAWGGVVDLDPDTNLAIAAAELWSEIAGARGPAEIALRRGARLAPRLVPITPAREPAIAWDAGTCLVTGGLGALGLRVAARLVDRGARHVVLVGRTPPPGRATWPGLDPASRDGQQARALEGLERSGARVVCVSGDVALDATWDLIDAAVAASRFPPVAAFVHAAGVQAPRPLAQLEASDLAADLAPKLGGALRLDRRAGTARVVLFSSAAALLRSPFLGAYAAANAGLDALAADCRARGLDATSIAWGFWAGAGMAERYRELEGEGRRLAPRGMGEIAVEDGLDVFERLAGAGPAHAAVLPMDWAAFRRFHPDAAMSSVVPEPARAAAPTRVDAVVDAGSIFDAPPGERLARLEGYLRARVARVLGLAEERVDPDVPLMRLGLDSLTAVELKNRIAAELGIVVPLVHVLVCPGFPALAARLLALAPARRADDIEELSL